jgi:hypothetical protein
MSQKNNKTRTKKRGFSGTAPREKNYMKYKQNCKTRTKKGGATTLLKTKEMGAILVRKLGDEIEFLIYIYRYHDEILKGLLQNGVKTKKWKKNDVNILMNEIEKFMYYILETVKINNDLKKKVHKIISEGSEAYVLKHKEQIQKWMVEKELKSREYNLKMLKIEADFTKLKAAALERLENENNKEKKNKKKNSKKKESKQALAFEEKRRSLASFPLDSRNYASRSTSPSADNNNNNPTFPVGAYDKLESDDEEVEPCRCFRCLELEEEQAAGTDFFIPVVVGRSY